MSAPSCLPPRAWFCCHWRKGWQRPALDASTLLWSSLAPPIGTAASTSPEDVGLSHMIKNFRHPDRSRAQRGAAEGPILRGPADKKRSLGYAAPSTSLGASWRLRSG